MQRFPRERAVDYGHVLTELLRERDGLLTVMDRALALGSAVRVSDYVTSSAITHHFDAQVRDDAVSTMYDIAERAAAALHERLRMRSALHDSVGALLFLIGVQVRDLHASIRHNPVLERRLHQLESDVSAASNALRESLLALSETTPERALPVELAEHARSFEARTGVPARFIQLGPLAPLDTERNAFLVAVAREGLLNVEKHAKPCSVILSLGPCDGGAHLVIADDGTGDPANGPPGTGMGVRTLVERAARLGGHVSLVRDDDGGCTLRAWLPDVESS